MSIPYVHKAGHPLNGSYVRQRFPRLNPQNQLIEDKVYISQLISREETKKHTIYGKNYTKNTNVICITYLLCNIK